MAKVATPEMLNAIRTDASEAYQAAVPVATANNLLEVGNPILTYSPVANEFVSALMNKIIFTLVYRKTWRSPLNFLRKDPIPLGFDIEEAQVNPAIASQYDPTDTGMADLLKNAPPDVASAYYRLNRTDKYKVTINNAELTNAFRSWQNLENFIAAIVDSLYNGNAIDEFKYTKQLVTDAITANKMTTVTVTNPTDKATAEQFQTELQGLSLAFTFPSTQYNNYVKMGGTEGARTTWSSIDDQIIIIRGDVAASVGVKFLAGAFNLSYADYATRQVVVDDFANPNVLAVLADKRAFEIREKMRRFTEFYNAATMAWQYYYHAWDLFSLSPFHNAVAVVAAPTNP